MSAKKITKLSMISVGRASIFDATVAIIAVLAWFAGTNHCLLAFTRTCGSVTCARNLGLVVRARIMRSERDRQAKTDACLVAVLQRWRADLIGWSDAPAHAVGFGSFQMAAIPTGGHSAGGRLVPALLIVLP